MHEHDNPGIRLHLPCYKECTRRASLRTARTFSAGSSRKRSALKPSTEACRSRAQRAVGYTMHGAVL